MKNHFIMHTNYEQAPNMMKVFINQNQEKLKLFSHFTLCSSSLSLFGLIFYPGVYALFPSKPYKIRQQSTGKINSNIRTQQRITGRAV
jgi:hypothetical protein